MYATCPDCFMCIIGESMLIYMSNMKSLASTIWQGMLYTDDDSKNDYDNTAKLHRLYKRTESQPEFSLNVLWNRHMGPELIWPNIPIGVNDIYEETLALTGVKQTVSINSIIKQTKYSNQ